MTGKCINIFHQKKSSTSKLSITSDNNAFFLVIFFIIFRVFNRKQKEYLKICYFPIFLIVIFLLKFHIKDGFSFNFISLQKRLTNEFLNLETIKSYYVIQHVTLHENLVCLAIIQILYTNINNFYQFFLVLSRDVTPNPGPVQISPAVILNI